MAHTEASTRIQHFSLLVERCEAQISAENSATLKVLVVAAQQPEASGTVGPRKP
jgi:hypothetical protein